MSARWDCRRQPGEMVHFPQASWERGLAHGAVSSGQGPVGSGALAWGWRSSASTGVGLNPPSSAGPHSQKEEAERATHTWKLLQTVSTGACNLPVKAKPLWFGSIPLAKMSQRRPERLNHLRGDTAGLEQGCGLVLAEGSPCSTPRGLGEPSWLSRQGREVWLSQDTQPWEQGEQGRPQRGKGVGVCGWGPGAITWRGVARCLLQFHSDSTGAGAAGREGKMEGRPWTHPLSSASPGHACQPQALSRESSHAPALQADSSF